jgi:hypothetical protein
VNDPTSYKKYPAEPLIYTAYFDFDMEILPPESDYEEPDNTPPYLLPPPENFYVEVGTYKQFYLGDVIDQEAVNQTVTVEVDYTSASRLINYDDVKRTFTIYDSVTTDLNIGFYDLTITIYDNFDTVVIDDYIECKDRTFTTEALKDACKDRVRGETIYRIKMEVRKKFEVGDVFVPPEVTEIIYEYQGQVFDLGNTTLEDVYTNIAVVGVVDEDNAIKNLDIDKIEEIDLARQDQQEGVDLDEKKAERDEANAQKEAETINDEIPIPRVEEITNDGQMKIAFSSELQVPDDYQQVKSQEVALRFSASRTETYLTDTGYQDF